MTAADREEHLRELAERVLIMARNTLIVRLRFMKSAISRLNLTFTPGIFGISGDELHYDPRVVLNAYSRDEAWAVRSYLHLVLHGVFRHMFIHKMVDREKWDLAADMAVENVISELALPESRLSSTDEAEKVLKEMKRQVPDMTAEKLYHHFRQHPLPEVTVKVWRELFSPDDHVFWYPLHPEEKREGYFPGQGDKEEEEGAAGGKNEDDEENSQSSDDEGRNSREEENSAGSDRDEEREPEGNEADSPLSGETEKLWQGISESILEDLQSFAKERGDKSGQLLLNLREAVREKTDYRVFLRSFAVRGEVMKVNTEEFDTIFYTYGLRLYGRVPLVEPLEYREEKRIRDFAVAIDTSASVTDEILKKFIRKTYSILKTTEGFFDKVNVHIFQCDAEITDHRKLTDREELDAYFRDLTVKGRGGTDFRPVIGELEKLVRKGEFTDLRGLLYLTDGRGIFPKTPPSFQTAFVFLGDEASAPDVPPWAIRLVLEEEDL